MLRTKNHPNQTEGGFLSHQLFRVTETVDSLAPLWVTLFTTVNVACGLLYGFEDWARHLLDGDLR